MTTSDATLTNANVNSGTSVNLGAYNITYTWKNITDSNDVPKSYDVEESTYAGFQSPIIVIQGIIPIDLNISNHISQKLLIDFATVRTGDITLTVTSGKNGGTNLGGRPSGGYSNSGNTLSSSLKVQVDTFVINFSSQKHREGEAWEYTLTLVETK